MREFAHYAVVVLAAALAVAGRAEGGKTEPALRLVIELVDGTRLVGTPAIESIPVRTPYATMDISLKYVLALRFEADHKTASIDLWNGDQIRGIIDLKPVELNTVFGKAAVAVAHIRQIRVRSSASLSQGLVVHFTFDADEGDVVTDRSGRGHHGAVHGATWVREGRAGGGFEFDGRGGHLRVAGSPAFACTNATLAAWIKPASYQTAHDECWPVIDSLSLRPNSGMQLVLHDNEIGFGYRSPGYSNLVDSEPVFTAADSGQWHLIAATYEHSGSRSRICLFVDGNLVKTAEEATPAMTYDGQILYVGINYDSPAAGAVNGYLREFNGLMDDIRIYNRALSAEEMRELYEIGSAQLPESPAGDRKPGLTSP